MESDWRAKFGKLALCHPLTLVKGKWREMTALLSYASAGKCQNWRAVESDWRAKWRASGNELCLLSNQIRYRLVMVRLGIG